MKRDGSSPVERFARHPYLAGRWGGAERDIDGISGRLGWGDMCRFEFGVTPAGETRLISAPHGQSTKSGVEADAITADDDVRYVSHGTSLGGAKAISMYGIDRLARLHIHFNACDVSGRLHGSNQMRYGTQVIITGPSAHSREEGISLRRSSNEAALSTGEARQIPPRFIRRVTEYPILLTLRGYQTGGWRISGESASPPIPNGITLEEEDEHLAEKDDIARSIYDPEPNFGKRAPIATMNIRYGREGPIPPEMHRDSDNSGGRGGRFDSQPFYGLAMATPGDSGLFDSDQEGDMHIDAKSEPNAESDVARPVYTPTNKGESTSMVEDDSGIEVITAVRYRGGRPVTPHPTQMGDALTIPINPPSCVTREA